MIEKEEKAMKKFKSAIALFLCVLMLSSVVSFGTAAENESIYPESEHYYQNNYYNEWTYTHPEEAEYLFVTFSRETRTEPGNVSGRNVYFDDSSVSLGDVIDSWQDYGKVGDYISIFDGDDNLIGVYQGVELAERTVFIPGNSFKITLTTDATITAYGFKIDSISAEVPDGNILTIVDFGNGKDKEAYLDNEWGGTLTFDSDIYGKIIDGEAVIGLEYEDGTVYEPYEPGNWMYWWPGPEIEDDKKIYRFKAVKTPVTLEKGDVYSFVNSEEYFNVDGEGHYYMKKEDYLRLVASACVIHGVGPYALPAAVTSAILLGYPNFTWNGSCIGFTTTVCLQKKGIFDVVKTQEGATCINDLEPTSDLISLMNYYNAQAALTSLTKNQSSAKTPKEFSRQLKKMFESAESGNLVLLEYLIGDSELNAIGNLAYHGFAISGAYTDSYGRHVLLYYDDNDARYGNEGICSVCWIEPDFSAIHTDYGDLQTIFWTDEFEAYKSIDYNGEDNSIKHYWTEFFTRIFNLLKEWFETYVVGIFKR